ncbi:MAG TPA: hypothetical protein PL045_09395, partial [Chitinophagaceae bacterium]|nr:hypothetical protein [Chitinophagaceae bacterium]
MKTNLLMLSVAILTLSVLQSCTKNSEVISKSNETQIATSEQSSDMLITDTSMLCYYPFNGTLKDKSGHGNNGVLSGTISYVTDRFGNAFKAVSFAASGAWIEIPEADFIGLRSVTISMDFFPTTDAFQELISKMSYSIPVGYPGFYQSFTTAL